MTEPTKVDIHHRRISQLSDFAELMEILFPGNRSQQYAAVCIFFELKWSSELIPSMSKYQEQYNISRRTLERTRAKLSRLGMIEYISHVNNRYGNQYGWMLSPRLVRTLRQLAEKYALYKNQKDGTIEKDRLLIQFSDAMRTARITNNNTNQLKS